MDIFIEKKKEICWNIKSERNNGVISLIANQSGMDLPDVTMKIAESKPTGNSIAFKINFEEFKHYYEIMKGFYDLVVSGDIDSPIAIESPENSLNTSISRNNPNISENIQYKYQQIEYNTAKAEAYLPAENIRGASINSQTQANPIQNKPQTQSQTQHQARIQTQANPIQNKPQTRSQTQHQARIQTQANPIQNKPQAQSQTHIKTQNQNMVNQQKYLQPPVDDFDNIVPIAPKNSFSNSIESNEDTIEMEKDIAQAMDLTHKILSQKQSAQPQTQPKSSLQNKERENNLVVKAPTRPIKQQKQKVMEPDLGIQNSTDLMMEETVYMDAVDKEITKWMDDFQKKKEKMKVKEMIVRTRKLESKMKQKNELEKLFHSGKISLEEYISQIEKLLY